MLTQFRQIRVLTRTNLAGIHRRLAISASMAFSVALAVCVLVGFLSMARGFEQTLTGTGSTSVAVVLGGGTSLEAGSEIPAGLIRSLLAVGADVGLRRDASGRPVISREMVQPVVLPRGGTAVTLALRGMDPAGATLRDGITLTGGRMFTPGAREIVVGARTAADVAGLGIGDSVRLGAVEWRVTGHFSARGGVFESEIWTGLEAAQSAFDRQGEVQTLRLGLTRPGDVTALAAALAPLSPTPLSVVTEADLFAGQSARTADLIRLFGWPLAALMAFGATAGALNTMMSSVSDRRVEIATLRTLGFSRLAAFGATWTEALVLAGLGTATGLLLSWLVFHGWQASTLGANNARMAFQLAVTPDVMLRAGLMGLLIGALGGLIPALSATRLPLTAALRAHG